MIVYPNKLFTYVRNGKTKQRYGYYMDDNLIANLELLRRQVENKYDGIFAITGNEGCGKTSISHAVAHYLSPTFNLDNVVFSGQELMNRIQKCNKYDVIIYDEAITALSTQDASSEMQNTIIKLFTTIRSKGLYIILILPNPFMLRRYFFVFRTKFLIHTYSTDGINRGFFKFYSYKRKKLMYLQGCKEWNMNVVRRNFSGRFINTEGFFLDPEAYETKKQNAIKAITEDKKTKEQQLKEQFEDSKLKLKIQIEQWKQRYQEKIEAKFARYKEQFKEIKLKNKSAIDEVQQKVIELDKTKTKHQLYELEKEYAKSLHFFYCREKEIYERNVKGTEYTYSTFIKFLEQNRISAYSSSKLRTVLQSGDDLRKLSSV